eukprot:4625074-Prorocentrum_lima.AAC.1
MHALFCFVSPCCKLASPASRPCLRCCFLQASRLVYVCARGWPDWFDQVLLEGIVRVVDQHIHDVFGHYV